MTESASREAVGAPPAESQEPGRGSLGEIFRVFLRLGLTSFGGPIAHLAYFRDELVTRRRWIGEAGFADLVALCQFLPGPASSQVGFSLGMVRGGGLAGGLVAWLAFTAPSALILLAFALGAGAFVGPLAHGLQHGLKLVAVAVIAQAVWGMARSLAPDRRRAGIALAALAVVVTLGGSIAQIAAIGVGGLAGLALCRDGDASSVGALRIPVSRVNGLAALGLFGGLLALPPLLPGVWPGLVLFDAFYRSGALVFGGGHVVLPLLQTQVVGPGWVSNEAFLTGYGLAQAMPGPLFAFAAYLGAMMIPAPSGVAGAGIALVALFLPGMLLVYGVAPFWDRLRARPLARAGMRGTNAAVVGVLGAAFYQPVWTSAVRSEVDFALAAGGLLLLTVWKLPPWIVVALLAGLGALAGVR